jgi:hypothetical protein
MKSIENYVDGLFAELPDSDRKAQLRNEIVQNLRDKVRDLMDQGKAEEDAVNKAIVDFGDVSDIKAELSATAQPTDKKRTAALALGFSLWGAALIIGLVLFVNLYYSPGVVWCVYPIFGVLWWPLGCFYNWLSKRHK